jgi:signal transduction histidine kinase
MESPAAVPGATTSVRTGARPAPTTFALAAAAFLFAAVTLGVGAASGAPLRFLLLDAAIGLAYLAAGLVAWQRRPEVLTGPFLVACSIFNFVGSYAPTGQPVVTHLGFALEGYYDVALAILVLALPGRLPTGRARGLSLALLAAFLVRSGSRLLLADPAVLAPDAGLPPNPFAVLGNADAFAAIETATNAGIAIVAFAIAVECLRRLVASRPIVRHVIWPILIGGVVAMGAATFDAADTASAAATGAPLLTLAEPWDEVFAWSLFAARLFVPVALLVGSLRLRRAAGPLVALAVGLGSVPSPVRLEAALAAALGDPGLRLVRPDADGQGWVAADGGEAAAPVETDLHAVTLLEHDGRPLAAIVHDPVLRENPALIGSVLAVLRLAVDNERLNTALQAQLEEVKASRARLVVAAEDERRRVERDLHDGAQQRLVAVTIALQQARQTARETGAAPELRDGLAATADELQAAIDDLRELARGIHPAILGDDGLAAAVGALARRSGVAVDVRSNLGRRLPKHVEATLYFTVAEALTNASRHARATRAVVSLQDSGDQINLRVEDDGRGGANASAGSGLRGLADRLAAVDGQLTITSTVGHGTTIHATVPLP